MVLGKAPCTLNTPQPGAPPNSSVTLSGVEGAVGRCVRLYGGMFAWQSSATSAFWSEPGTYSEILKRPVGPMCLCGRPPEQRQGKHWSLAP